MDDTRKQLMMDCVSEIYSIILVAALVLDVLKAANGLMAICLLCGPMSQEKTDKGNEVVG